MGLSSRWSHQARQCHHVGQKARATPALRSAAGGLWRLLDEKDELPIHQREVAEREVLHLDQVPRHSWVSCRCRRRSGQ